MSSVETRNPEVVESSEEDDLDAALDDLLNSAFDGVKTPELKNALDGAKTTEFNNDRRISEREKQLAGSEREKQLKGERALNEGSAPNDVSSTKIVFKK
jgi:hypothetical protein